MMVQKVTVMKIGIVSDSHGEVENLKDAVDWLVDGGAEKIIHLGDDYDDAEGLKIEVIRVPGVFSRYYKDPEIPNRRIEEIEGWRVLLTHTEQSHENDLPTDIKPEEVIERREVELVLCGHTHIPKIEEKGGILYINPGHLKKKDKKGYPPSFASVEFTREKVDAKIIDLKSKEIILEREMLKP